jgi:hypothetical protein
VFLADDVASRSTRPDESAARIGRGDRRRRLGAGRHGDRGRRADADRGNDSHVSDRRRRSEWLSTSRPDVVRQVVGWWRRGIGFWRFGNGAVHDNDATRLEVVASPRARPRLLAWTLSDGVTRTVSASGDRLAIVTDSKRAGRVYWQDKRVVVCGGGPACAPVRTPPSRVTVDAAWSPDGHVLAFVEAPNLSFPGWPQRLLQRWYAAHRVSLLDAATGRVRSVARTSGATVPVWSADGRLLYVARDGLWLLPTLSSDPVEIAAPLFPRRTWPAYYGQVAWSAQFAWWSPR